MKSIRGVLFLAVCGLLTCNVFAQTKFDLSISDISYKKVHENWLKIPKSADLRVMWEIEGKEISGLTPTENTQIKKHESFTYQVYVYENGDQRQPLIREVDDGKYLDLFKVKMSKQLSFKVKAFNAQAMLVAESEVASIVVGIGDDGSDGEHNGLLYFLHPGRAQLAMVGKADIYDRSTLLGKTAFMFLSITAMISFLVLIFYSSRTLYLGNIFPYKKTKRELIWSTLLSCDISYANRLTHKFKFILNAWETIATNSRTIVEKAVNNIPETLSSTEKLASVDVACMEYWTNDGDKAIGTIEDIIAYPDYKHVQVNGKIKNADDLLSELVIKIEDNFHEIVGESNNGQAQNGNGVMHDMKNLIAEIYEPVEAKNKFFSKVNNWVLRKGVFSLKEGLRPFPTSRIIQAGLEIHRMGGHRWLKPTEGVKRAFEDRASNEIEVLKRKSKIEWFWNYGALAPLVGLFGTVTGITYAFQQLSNTGANPDFSNTIQLLSNGIFEALWTTIFGLANGICFIVIYHYYKHKLDWIYSKWEEIYVTITEKL